MDRANALLTDLRGALPVRVQLLLRRGLLPALLSVVCLGLGLFLAVEQWISSVNQTTEVETYLNLVLSAEHEPRRDEREVGRVALLLAGVNQGGESEASLRQGRPAAEARRAVE